MTEIEVCVCGDPLTLHRLNPEISNRNECWALNDDQMKTRYCQCRQFRAPRAQEEARDER